MCNTIQCKLCYSVYPPGMFASNDGLLACPRCIERKTIRVCSDCYNPFEVINERNPNEARCLTCQIKYRQAEGDKKRNWEEFRARLSCGS
jgi:hypothetical protein